jgi:hypothetical protein
VDFTEEIFPEEGVDFSDASFGDGAHFWGSVFGQGAHFWAATFGDDVQFWKTKFGDGAQFAGATFGDDVVFSEAEFGSMTQFYGATFGDDVDFSAVEFGDEVSFSEAQFGDQVDFSVSTFGDNVRFTDVVFGNWFDVSGSEFKGRCLFAGKEERPLFLQEDGRVTEASLARVIFIMPENVMFRSANLSRTKLLHTDVRRMEFTDITWPKIEEGNGVYDELAAEESDRIFPYGAIARLYRRLKQNYEDQRDYGRGGDFHFREKEMMRQNPDSPLKDRIVLEIYRAVSGYSERYWAAGWFLGLIIACSLLSLLLGLHYTASEEMQWTLRRRPDDFIRSLMYGAQTVFARPPSYMVPTTLWGEAVKLATMVLGPLFLGLFALAVRQRVRR